MTKPLLMVFRVLIFGCTENYALSAKGCSRLSNAFICMFEICTCASKEAMFSRGTIFYFFVSILVYLNNQFKQIIK